MTKQKGCNELCNHAVRNSKRRPSRDNRDAREKAQTADCAGEKGAGLLAAIRSNQQTKGQATMSNTGTRTQEEVQASFDARIAKERKKLARELKHWNVQGNRYTLKKQLAILALSCATIINTEATPQINGKYAPFSARETELVGFEHYDEVLLTLEKPLYRVGQIMQLAKDGRWVVPIESHFDGKQWVYKVVEVKVGAR